MNRYKWLFGFALIFLLFSRTAHAYIDPGAGSMMLQIMLGAIIGIGFWCRDFIARIIKSIFKK